MNPESEHDAEGWITASGRDVQGRRPIWTKEIQRGVLLDLYDRDPSYRLHDWILRHDGRIIGAGELERRQGEMLTATAVIRREWRGKKLYQTVLKAFADHFGVICSMNLMNVSAAAQKSWESAGGTKGLNVKGLMRYCLDVRKRT